MTSSVQNNQASSSLMDAVNGSRGSKSVAQEAQDRFMTLLVTQMKNQDPLNPLDNAQVTSQLAQLSTVTGIDRLNDTLESIVGSVQAGQSMQAAGMIGHVVLTAGNNIDLLDGDGLYAIDLPASADVKVTVKDAQGSPVREIDLGRQSPGLVELRWDGMTGNGAAAPDGRYFFEVAATANGARVDAVPLAYSVVNSVSNGANGMTMNLSNMQSVGLAEVRQVY